MRASGASLADALTGGYHLAFAVGSVFALAAAGLGAWFMRNAAARPGRGVSMDNRASCSE